MDRRRRTTDRWRASRRRSFAAWISAATPISPGAALEFFLKRYNDQGFLTTGYTLVGTGEHLWTLAEFYARQGDRRVVEKGGADVGPSVQVDRRPAGEDQAARHPRPARARVWPRSAGRDAPIGIVSPIVCSTTFSTAADCRTAAQALAEIGHPDAPALLADAKSYREDLQRAYRWMQGPLPRRRAGQRHVGAELLRHARLFRQRRGIRARREDSNRTWCYSIEIGMHQLAANRLRRSALATR